MPPSARSGVSRGYVTMVFSVWDVRIARVWMAWRHARQPAPGAFRGRQGVGAGEGGEGGGGRRRAMRACQRAASGREQAARVRDGVWRGRARRWPRGEQRARGRARWRRALRGDAGAGGWPGE